MKSKYTPEMEARIQQVAEQEGLNLETCQALADEKLFADVSARGIIAKARLMGLDYQKQERTAKDGSPVMRKDEIVAAIERQVGAAEGEFDSLEKAGKEALKALLDRVSVTETV